MDEREEGTGDPAGSAERPDLLHGGRICSCRPAYRRGDRGGQSLSAEKRAEKQEIESTNNGGEVKGTFKQLWCLSRY